MSPFLLAAVYMGLFLTGAGAAFFSFVSGNTALAITSLILGTIALQDAYSWWYLGEKGNQRITSRVLNGIDVVGVLCGLLAVLAPAAGWYQLTLWASLGYILACLAFWSLFPRLDGKFYEFVVEVWSMKPGDTRAFVIAFAIAAVALVVLLIMTIGGLWGDVLEWRWVILNSALSLYCILYAVIGPTGTLLLSSGPDPKPTST